MCQWLGTEPEGENWLRGRALNVETSAVESGWCCGEEVDMAGADVEIDAPCQWARWRGRASLLPESEQIVGCGGKRCRDVSPRTENDVYSIKWAAQVTGEKYFWKRELPRDIVMKALRLSTASTHTTATTRIVDGGQVEPKAAP